MLQYTVDRYNQINKTSTEDLNGEHDRWRKGTLQKRPSVIMHAAQLRVGLEKSERKPHLADLAAAGLTTW